MPLLSPLPTGASAAPSPFLSTLSSLPFPHAPVCFDWTLPHRAAFGFFLCLCVRTVSPPATYVYMCTYASLYLSLPVVCSYCWYVVLAVLLCSVCADVLHWRVKCWWMSRHVSMLAAGDMWGHITGLTTSFVGHCASLPCALGQPAVCMIPRFVSFALFLVCLCCTCMIWMLRCNLDSSHS